MEDPKRIDQFVCVVNKKYDPSRIMNAVAHMAAGLVNVHSNSNVLTQMRFRDFVDKDKSIHPSISENGFIILRADNGNKLRTLRSELIKRDIKFTDFTDVMIEGNHITQQLEFDNKQESELDYLGVCFFTAISTAKELTKKFSIYRFTA